MKYLKVFLELAGLSFKRYFENRFNAFGYMASNVSMLLVVLVFIEVYFSFSKEILGWTKYEVFFLAGLYRIITASFIVFFQRSINYLTRYVKSGELDIFLTKPVDSQFYISFRLMRSYDFIGIIAGAILIYYSLSRMGYSSDLFSWLQLLTTAVAGLTILYSIVFSLATLTIWFGRFNALMDIYYIMREPLSNPIDLLGAKVSFVLTYFLPLAFVVTIPSKIFFGKISWEYTLLSGAIALAILLFSHWFWNFSLKHYTSASS